MPGWRLSQTGTMHLGALVLVYAAVAVESAVVSAMRSARAGAGAGSAGRSGQSQSGAPKTPITFNQDMMNPCRPMDCYTFDQTDRRRSIKSATWMKVATTAFDPLGGEDQFYEALKMPDLPPAQVPAMVVIDLGSTLSEFLNKTKVFGRQLNDDATRAMADLKKKAEAARVGGSNSNSNRNSNAAAAAAAASRSAVSDQSKRAMMSSYISGMNQLAQQARRVKQRLMAPWTVTVYNLVNMNYQPTAKSPLQLPSLADKPTLSYVTIPDFDTYVGAYFGFGFQRALNVTMELAQVVNVPDVTRVVYLNYLNNYFEVFIPINMNRFP